MRYVRPCAAAVVERATLAAASQVGTLERPGNRGPDVARYLRAVRLAEGYPYCLAGIVWAYDTARADQPLPMQRTGSTWRLWSWTVQHAAPAPWRVRRGDVLLWNLPGTQTGHAELVEHVRKGGWVRTIGWNTTRPGVRGSVRDGGGVHRHNRLTTHPLARLHLMGVLGFTNEEQTAP